MRMGEVRGLCWEDIDFDNKVINIRNNYVPLDGKKHLKGTKRKRPSRRARKVPLRSELLPGLNEVMGICPYEFSGEGYVLFNLNNPDIPLAKSSLQRGITRILSKIGISPEEKKKRNITFHSLRHNFITMAQKSGLSLIETSALAGHSTVIMTDYYTHAEQVVDMEETRLKLENGCKG
jgi:integrase